MTVQHNNNTAKANIVVFVTLSDAEHHQNLPLELARQMNAEHYSAAGFKQSFGVEVTPQHQWLNNYLQQQKALGRQIVLQTTSEPSDWRDACLSQADRVFYIAQADESSQSLPVSFWQLASNKAELVLLYQHPGQKPCDTAAKRQAFRVNRHHHIRLYKAADIQRLARDICGKSIALVLGGGGARSFVHIGVLKAMEELGIAVDRIGGTSMGAIVAAQYAAGHSPDEMLALNDEVWVKGRPHKGFTLPMTSLLSARRAKRLTQGIFADAHIEDLWLDFFCVSSDLTDLKCHVHEHGVVWPALLASGAIPGVCSSIVSEQGSVLVDGGVLDNLPVASMKARHQGPVIAVDVTSTRGLKANTRSTIPPNGMKALWDYLNPFAKHRRYPSMLKLLSHTASLAAKVNARSSRQLADLCLMPQCYQFKSMDMSNLHRLVEQGYREAMPKLQTWLQQDRQQEQVSDKPAIFLPSSHTQTHLSLSE